MPAGWKPGNPLHGAPAVPPAAAPAAAAAADSPAAAAQQPGATPPPPPPLPAAPGAAEKPQRPILDASFLVLNPDLEEAVEEEYSSDYSDSE